MYPNLKLELWRQGIRQNRLARVLGIDETLLSRILNGFREPDAQTRARIADLLHVDERWLFQADVRARTETAPGRIEVDTSLESAKRTISTGAKSSEPI